MIYEPGAHFWSKSWMIYELGAHFWSERWIIFELFRLEWTTFEDDFGIMIAKL